MKIWMVIDELKEVIHFIHVRTLDFVNDLWPTYVDVIARLPRLPEIITFDRDAKFVSKYLGSLQCALGTSLRLSMTFHPWTDGRSWHTIQTLDMMCYCFLY